MIVQEIFEMPAIVTLETTILDTHYEMEQRRYHYCNHEAEAIFHGFTPIQRECFFREEEGADAEKAKRYKEMYGSMIPSIKQMLRKRAFHNMVRRDMKVIRRYRHNRTYKKNDYTFMDRKRKWRIG